MLTLPMKSNAKQIHGIHACNRSFCTCLSSDWFCMLNVFICMEVMLYRLLHLDNTDTSFTSVSSHVTCMYSHLEGDADGLILGSMKASPTVIYEKPMRNWLHHLNLIPVLKKVKRHECETMHQLGRLLSSLDLPAFFALFFLPHSYCSFCPERHIEMLSSNPFFVAQNLKHVVLMRGVHSLIDCEAIDAVRTKEALVFNFQDPMCLRNWYDNQSMSILNQIESAIANGAKHVKYEKHINHSERGLTGETLESILVKDYDVEFLHSTRASPLQSPAPQQRDERRRKHQTRVSMRIPELRKQLPDTVLDEVLSLMCERDKAILLSALKPVMRPYRQLWERRDACLSALRRVLPASDEDYAAIGCNVPTRLVEAMRSEMRALEAALCQAKRALVCV